MAAAFAIDDQVTALRRRLGDLGSASGTRHSSLDLNSSVDYIERVADDYLRYSGRPQLAGRAAEIGPGDNAGVAMLLRGRGVTQIDLIDRFYSHREGARQSMIYEALSKRHGLQHLLGEARAWDESAMDGITWHIGASAETFFLDNPQSYDVIVSRAVMEHLMDPIAALEAMAQSLGPGGIMVHRVDLRDHGMFTPEHHPLTFLRWSDRKYRRMSRHSGRPNRVLLADYLEALDRLATNATPFTHRVLVTRLVGQPGLTTEVPMDSMPADALERALQYVDDAHASMAPRFQAQDPVHLAVAGMVLVVERGVAS